MNDSDQACKVFKWINMKALKDLTFQTKMFALGGFYWPLGLRLQALAQRNYFLSIKTQEERKIA